MMKRGKATIGLLTMGMVMTFLCCTLVFSIDVKASNTGTSGSSSQNPGGLGGLEVWEDRHEESPSTPRGTNPIATNPDNSSSTSTSTPAIDNEDFVDRGKVEEKKQKASNTVFVDTLIFTTGILLWVAATMYVTITTANLVFGGVILTVIRKITFGKVTHLDTKIGTILIKFIALAAIGTLFTSGFVKFAIVKLYGWLLTKGGPNV